MIETLGHIEPTALGAVEVVGLLDDVLESKDLGPRLFAQRVLTSLGPTAAPAIPRLIALSRRPDIRASEEIGSVATALGRIAPGTPDEDRAIAALTEMLRSEPNLQQIEAIDAALARFGPEAATAPPPSRAMTRSSDSHVSAAARKGLSAIGDHGR